MLLTIDYIKEILSNVTDPEIPALSIEDIGILREVIINQNEVEIVITPTYSGCPAMYFIENQVRETLTKAGILNFKINTILSPAWTTDWMSETAKMKLKESGIAPPISNSKQFDQSNIFNIIKILNDIECPFCNSRDTKVLNEFGSTACKSLHFCNECLQAFDHFKCH